MTARLDVTAALIFNQGKILVTRRPYGTRHAGWWEFPGGKREPGETLEACLAREIQEELSLPIEVVRPYARVEHDDGEIALTLHALLCRTVDWTPGLTPPGSRWVQPEDLTKVELLPPDRVIAEKIIVDGIGE